MKAKMLLASGAMLLSMVAIGSAKSWDIVVDTTTKAGQTTLPAGNYSVKLKDNQAIFREEGSGKTYNVPVKVEQGQQKFGETAVETRIENGTQIIQDIQLGGTVEKLDFPTE